MAKVLKNVPKEIWCLCFATLISRSGTMALLFLSIYLSSLGISETGAGLTISAYGLGALIAAPLAGYMSDRVGPCRIMKLGLLAQGFILLIFPVAGDFKSVVFITLAWSLAGEAFRPASSAFISGFADEKLRRVAFGLNRIAVNIGMSIGPALGGILTQTRPSYIFVANGGASILAGTFLAYSLRRKEFAHVSENGQIWKQDNDRQCGEAGRLPIFLLALAPAFIVFYQYRSTMPQYFVERRILEPSIFGLLLSINALLVIAFQTPLTLCLRRWPKKFGISLGALLIGTGFGCFALVTTFFGAAICVVVWTFGQMALLSGSELYVSEIAGGKKGRYMGWYHMVMNFCAFLGPVFGSGMLRYSSAMLWEAMFICGVISALVLLHVTKQANVARNTVERVAVP